MEIKLSKIFNTTKNKRIEYKQIISRNFSRNYFTNRTKFKKKYERIDELFSKYNLQRVNDWVDISNENLKEIDLQVNSLQIDYENKKEFGKLLTTIFPHYQWKFLSLNNKKISKIISINKQQQIMEKLFIKLNLKRLEDWNKISKSKIESVGGKILLLIYKGDLKKLLEKIYPNYPWIFLSQNSNLFFQSIENQREFMDQFYLSFNLKSFDDWLNISQRILCKFGGKILIEKYYQRDQKKLLENIYPNYPWDFMKLKYNKNKINKEEININIKKKRYKKYLFKSIEKQREFMDKLFIKLKLKSLDDWLKIKRMKFLPNGGEILIYKIYKNNMNNLLLSIYPNYPWTFLTNEKIFKKFSIIEKHQRKMDKLFKKLKFQSISDWIKYLKFTVAYQRQNSSLKLLSYYNNNIKEFLQFIYPNYPWKFERKKKLIEKQREFMDELFIKFNLNSLDDWTNFSIEKIIIENGGEKLISKKYQNMKIFLTKIYPNFPFEFKKFINYKLLSTKLKNRIRKKLDYLFIKFNLLTIENWLFKRSKIFNIRDRYYLKYMQKELPRNNENLFQFLKLIYPNFPWQLNLNEYLNYMKISPNQFLKSIENQRKFMDELFIKFNLNSLDDWRSAFLYLNIKNQVQNNIININNIINENNKNNNLNENNNLNNLINNNDNKENFNFNGLNNKNININNNNNLENNINKEFKLIQLNQFEKRLMKKLTKRYNRDWKLILQNIYPNFPWNFEITILRNYILKTMKKYQINQKKDWFRLLIPIRKKLKIFFPSEKWKISNFNIRKKKTTQRLLFSFTQKIYPSLLIFEDYFHPKLTEKKIKYELDIFIPSLQLAMEYQGEQHYDDMPAGFGYIELSQSRDKIKERLAKNISIKIIYIPYWWDQSLSSLKITLSIIKS